MKKSRVWRNLVFILVFCAFLSLAANPYKLPKLETQIPVVTSVWNWLQETTFHLGLDLQGGTQLDYEIDLRQAEELNNDDNPDNDIVIPDLINGVKEVIERRVNSLGVAEPNIYLSSVGEEQHIVVELPGVKDLAEAKDKVGKVVQLEFKTEKEGASDDEVEAVQKQADEFLKRVQSEESVEDLEEYAEDVLVPNRVQYKKQEKAFIDELPDTLQPLVKEMEPGTFYNKTVQAKDGDYVVVDGQVKQPEGINVFRLVEKGAELRKRPTNAESFESVMKELGQSADDQFHRESGITPEKLALEVTSLEAQEVTGVVETDEGFFIAQLNEKLGESEEEQYLASHILFKTETPEQLKLQQPTKEVPLNASEEEAKKIQEENAKVLEQNKAIAAENEEITKRNEPLIERNKEIKTKAEEILAKVKEDPSLFGELAKEYSEDTVSAEKNGDLGFAPASRYVKPFGDALTSLENGGITDELVQSEFGYHIILKRDTKQPSESLYKYSLLRVCYEGAVDCESSTSKDEAKTQAEELLRRVREENVYTIERIWFNTVPDPWQKTELDGRYFKRADVAYDQITYRPYVQVQFNDEGAKIFEQLTEANVQKRIGIFVGGEFVSAPTVQQKISGGIAQITLGISNVQVALQQANELARSLNAGSIPAPLKKPNELNIGASLGDESLQKSIQAGIIGLLLLAVFMIFYYRMLGAVACASLIVYGLFLSFIIQSEMSPAIAFLITIVMWLAFSLRLFRAKMDLSAKLIFLSLSVLGVYFIFSVFITPIVLTLAGVAGLILSIGMAVDANILIFERMKEEFATGKSFTHAVSDGFERAWSSILDSNVSTLITCAILYYFGTSIIQGFAINLAVGVVISMFTAITVSKIFVMVFSGTALEQVRWLWKRK